MSKSIKAEYVCFCLDTIIAQNQIKSWTDLKDSGLIALDAPSTELTIIFNDGLTISISDSKELPSGGKNAISEIVAVFESYMD